eukprot:1988830-Pyramimonas_sp.AAC.3
MHVIECVSCAPFGTAYGLKSSLSCHPSALINPPIIVIVSAYNKCGGTSLRCPGYAVHILDACIPWINPDNPPTRVCTCIRY